MRRSPAIVLLFAAVHLLFAQSGFALFDYVNEETSHAVPSGASVSVGLFYPVPAPGLPPPPYPVAIIHHGFLRSHSAHRNNAIYMARRGIITLTVDVDGWDNNTDNMTAMVSHFDWLAARGATVGDPLYGMVNTERMGMAGHSMGSHVVFRSTVAMQQGSGIKPYALLLLDGYPMDAATSVEPQIQPLNFGSFRANEVICNGNNQIIGFLHNMPFPVDDLWVRDSEHCDVENPTDAGCTLLCQGGNAPKQLIFQRLIYLFFQDALGVTSVEVPPQSYQEGLDAYLATNDVVIYPSGNATPSPTPSPTATPIPTDSPSPAPSESPSPSPTDVATPTASPTATACGRATGDFDSTCCTDINDFLFLLDNWQTETPLGPPQIGIEDFLALLDNWQVGSGC